MTWTEITRYQHDRRALRYASDCTDAEWALIKPLMPGPSKVGRPRKTCMRSVWDAIQYIATTGCQWALLPKDFSPFTTVQYYFYGFLYDALRMQPLEVRDGSFALRGTSPYTIRSSSRNSSTKGLASSSHLRFRCRSLARERS